MWLKNKSHLQKQICSASGDGLIEEGGVNMWRAVIVVGIVFALLAYACIVVGARSEDNRAGGN